MYKFLNFQNEKLFFVNILLKKKEIAPLTQNYSAQCGPRTASTPNSWVLLDIFDLENNGPFYRFNLDLAVHLPNFSFLFNKG